jgi:hypothetical protein
MKKHAGMLLTGLSTLILAAGLVAYAQDGPPGPPDREGILAFEAGPGGPGHLVKGAPVSAQTSFESVEVLADGTHIDRKSAGAFYRDSQGRTRREETMPPIGPAAESGDAHHLVFIQDPVAGAHYLLEPDQKIARQMPVHEHGGGPRDEMAGKRPRGGDSANVATESLGTQTINGVGAAGTRTTRTIPAGQIGNDKPIQIVVERWYSAELQMNVMTKRTDPRMGTTTTQLTNISREEPAASLFQVPADYTVKQGRARGFAPPAPQGAPPPAPVQPE